MQGTHYIIGISQINIWEEMWVIHPRPFRNKPTLYYYTEVPRYGPQQNQPISTNDRVCSIAPRERNERVQYYPPLKQTPPSYIRDRMLRRPINNPRHQGRCQISKGVCSWGTSPVRYRVQPRNMTDCTRVGLEVQIIPRSRHCHCCVIRNIIRRNKKRGKVRDHEFWKFMYSQSTGTYNSIDYCKGEQVKKQKKKREEGFRQYCYILHNTPQNPLRQKY